MKTVLYPGSFDPFTKGHLDLVERAGQLFDRVVVAVAVNAAKSPIFTMQERCELIRESCAALAHVEVVAIDGLLVDSLDKYGAKAILRGLRAFSDFEYELQMALMQQQVTECCRPHAAQARCSGHYPADAYLCGCFSHSDRNRRGYGAGLESLEIT